MGWESEDDAAAFAAAVGEKAVEAAEKRRDGGNAALIAEARSVASDRQPVTHDIALGMRLMITRLADALEASDAAQARARREGAAAMREAAAQAAYRWPHFDDALEMSRAIRALPLPDASGSTCERCFMVESDWPCPYCSVSAARKKPPGRLFGQAPDIGDHAGPSVSAIRAAGTAGGEGNDG